MQVCTAHKVALLFRPSLVDGLILLLGLLVLLALLQATFTWPPLHGCLDYTEIGTSVQALGYINQPLRVVTSSSHHGPTLNILEQWAAIFFLDLQPREIADNLPANILSQISTSDMQFGVGIREPLAEGFSLRDFPMRGSPFELSESQLKRQLFQRKKGSTPFVSPF